MDHYEEVTCDCLACHISRTENEETNFQGENDDDDSNYNYSYDDAVTAEMKWR